MSGARGQEELLPIGKAARALELKEADLRRRLEAAEVVLVDGLELTLRQTNLVAIRRAGAQRGG